MYGEQLASDWSLLCSPQWHHTGAEWQRITSSTYSNFSFMRWNDVETCCTLLHMWMPWDHTWRGVFNQLTWYDSSPWDDVFINNVFSTLPSSDGRKISLKDAFPLGGITWDRQHTWIYIITYFHKEQESFQKTEQNLLLLFVNILVN